MLQKGGKSLNAFERLNFDHVIRALSFGNPNEHAEILARFSEYQEHTRFDMVKDKSNSTWAKFNHEPEKAHYSWYDFAVLVPHVFIDKTGPTEQTYTSYSYSFTSNKKVVEPAYLLLV